MDEAFKSACVDRPCSRTTTNGVYFERLHVPLNAYASVRIQKLSILWALDAV